MQTIVYFDAFTLSYGHAVAGVKHNDWRILIFDIFDVHGIAGSLDDGTTGAFRLCVIVEEACGVVARTTENDDIVVFRDGETVGTCHGDSFDGRDGFVIEINGHCDGCLRAVRVGCCRWV